MIITGPSQGYMGNKMGPMNSHPSSSLMKPGIRREAQTSTPGFQRIPSATGPTDMTAGMVQGPSTMPMGNMMGHTMGLPMGQPGMPPPFQQGGMQPPGNGLWQRYGQLSTGMPNRQMLR